MLKRPGVSVIAILGLLLAGLLAYGVLSGAQDRSLEAAIARGDRPAAPDHVLPVLDGGGRRSLADYRGRVVVLNFWASWCAPCREEAPLLGELHRELGRRGTVLGVTYKDDPSDSRGFMRELGIGYPSLRDSKLELAPRYGTARLPETFVIDPRGRIVAVGRGPVDEAFLRAAVARALSA